MNTPVAVPRRTKLSTSSQNAVVSPSLRRRSPSRACTARSSTSDANALARAPAAASLLIDHLEHRVERLAHALQLLAGAQEQLVDPDEAQVAAPPQIAQTPAGILIRRHGGVELARR